MNSTSKPTVPAPAQKAPSGPTPPTKQSTPPPPSASLEHPHPNSPDLVCCIVHRLEDAVKLTEGLHLTDEQKTKISALTKKQTEESQALCAKAHEGHKATHAQILALLTPDQQQKLHALETTMPEHSTGGPGSAGGKERHPAAV